MTAKTYSIVGQKHLDLDPYLVGTPSGIEAVLVREPTNQHDPNAVQVWINGARVGYIPKKDNVALCQFIEQSGEPWTEPTPEGIAQDSEPVVVKALRATFVRSPNSGYPQVQVV